MCCLLAIFLSCGTEAPEVDVTSPTDGEIVGGIVAVIADARDNAGVMDVEFYIDDTLHFDDLESPYEYQWNTYGLEDNSTHTIYAIAYDRDGNETASDAISVIVDNEGFLGPHNEIFIVSGELNGESLSVANPAVTVQAGANIVGEVTMRTVNLGESGWVAPLAGTPSWGSHSASYWGINSSIATDTSFHTTTVAVTAPVDTGLYHIYFAWGHEMTYDDVMSLTHWEYPAGPVWDDDVDVADWADSLAQSAIDHGFVNCRYLWSDGAYGPRDVPAAAIRVYVVQ